MSESTTDLLYFAESVFKRDKNISAAIIAEVSAYFDKQGIVIAEIENLKKDLGI